MLYFVDAMAPWRESEYTWGFKCCGLKKGSASGDLFSNASWHKNSSSELTYKPKGVKGCSAPRDGLQHTLGLLANNLPWMACPERLLRCILGFTSSRPSCSHRGKHGSRFCLCLLVNQHFSEFFSPCTALLYRPSQDIISIFSLSVKGLSSKCIPLLIPMGMLPLLPLLFTFQTPSCRGWTGSSPAILGAWLELLYCSLDQAGIHKEVCSRGEAEVQKSCWFSVHGEMRLSGGFVTAAG